MQDNSVVIFINGHSHQVTPGVVQGSILISLAKLEGPQQFLLEVPDELDVPVDPNDRIIIKGNERFSIGKGAPPLEDNPCFRNPIRFHMNGSLIPESAALHHPKISVADFKKLVLGSQPADNLYADIPDVADERLQDDWRIIVKHVDRYILSPCGNVGFTSLEDEFGQIKAVYPNATLLSEGGNKFLLIPDYALPEHWSTRSAELLIMIPAAYPMAALDMFYLSPTIHLRDGRVPEGGGGSVTFFSRSWQQISWHYTNAWRPGMQNLWTHLHFCKERLNQVK